LVVFLPLFGTENNFSPYAIGIILAIRAGTTMISRFFLGRLSNRFSTYQLLMVSTTVSIIACAAMAFASTPFSLGAIVFVAGFSLGIGQPLTMSLVSQKTVANERALAVSARLMGNRFGQFLVPAGAGAIAASAGAGGVFIALSVLLATSLFGASSR
jgi:MFS family permease